MYDPRTRQRAISWWLEHGRNVAATCENFGIARSTFYRWLERYDPEHPIQSLRSRWRPPSGARTRPQEALFLRRFLDLHVQHPRWGKRKLRQALAAMHPTPPSESTIGRWLAVVLRKCPVCFETGGVHRAAMHANQKDLDDKLPDKLKMHLPRPARNSSKRDAVAAAERIVKRARGHGQH